VRRDNTGLSEASSKRFIDELMTMVRRGIDRKRTFSTSSGSSTASGQLPSTSTPRQRMQQGSNLTTDLECVTMKRDLKCLRRYYNVRHYFRKMIAGEGSTSGLDGTVIERTRNPPSMLTFILLKFFCMRARHLKNLL
jgi:hypothetical protein